METRSVFARPTVISREQAARARASPGAGYFARESVVRQVWREPIVMIGGMQRAVLVMAAHPRVAAAFATHYPESEWRRLGRTVLSFYAVLYGERDTADRAAANVQALHAAIRREVPSRESGARVPYSALDPELLLWVLTAMVDTSLVMYEAFVRPLSFAERNEFYDDMRTVGRLFGLRPELTPPRLEEFREHQRKRLECGEIELTTAAREIAARLLNPPLPLGLRPLGAAFRSITVAYLPAHLRRAYGLRGGWISPFLRIACPRFAPALSFLLRRLVLDTDEIARTSSGEALFRLGRKVGERTSVRRWHRRA